MEMIGLYQNARSMEQAMRKLFAFALAALMLLMAGALAEENLRCV